MLHQRLSQDTGTTAAISSQRRLPPSLLMARRSPSGDTTNLIFGILMAILSLITIYQAARLAALHNHSPRESSFRATCFAMPLTLGSFAEHNNIVDVEMANASGLGPDASISASHASAEDHPQLTPSSGMSVKRE
jgi:hypothetical protein